MTMVKAHVSTHGLVAGRYRLLDVVHRETNRVSWYAEYTEYTAYTGHGEPAGDAAGAAPGGARTCLVTRVGLPAGMGYEEAVLAAERVVRVSATMARLCPGRVAAVLDAVAEDGSLWTVTEPIDGPPLGQLMDRKGPFEAAGAAEIALDVLDVLEVAHEEGITHGELSPGQIFVPTGGGPAVLTGFGIAGATLVPRLAAPAFASPEQARNDRIGPAADLWAMGALLYTMLEGRPPYRDRDRPETTLRGVDRLPLRTPLRAASLGPVVLGLLRKDSRERMTRPQVREALERVLDEEPTGGAGAGVRRAFTASGPGGGRWSGRAVGVGTTLAVVLVATAALAATGQLPGLGGGSTGDARARPSATLPPTGGPGNGNGAAGGARAPPAPAPVTPAPSSPAPASPGPDRPSGTPTPSRGATPSPTPSGGGLPKGFKVLTSPEGFAVALPKGWKALETARAADGSYRVTFGAQGDPRTLAVTSSVTVGPDPVAIWREDVEPNLREIEGFRRLGDIEATTYQGFEAADMEWLSKVDGVPVRTFGRGFLLGPGKGGFSLRWTTPAGDWDDRANRDALDAFLATFDPYADTGAGAADKDKSADRAAGSAAGNGTTGTRVTAGRASGRATEGRAA
ncbi:serine/threonine protein kinase [Streptomyces sp. NPDC058204]|uniref:serine/threonine protein kinase n=1 Tax=Streptomyces sp. NPDC058204 TaxID=3346381 RepID=UPI0036E4EECF